MSLNSKTESVENGQCRILVGTSGYSYAEWVEAGFYPPGTSSGKMLGFYSGIFPVSELNFTWYQMPAAEALERMRLKAPANFSFAAKLTRTMTHEVEAAKWREEAKRYRDGVAPLLHGGQLAAVLVQLPPGFDRTPDNRRYLASLFDSLEGLPLAVEFRHDSWENERVFEGLKQRGIALAAVDEPKLPGLFPALDAVTNPNLFYVRFHGRNEKGWRSGTMQRKFDYDYSRAELAEWLDEKIVGMAEKTKNGLIFFNNHVRAQAPKNARTMVELLREKGLGKKNEPQNIEQGMSNFEVKSF